MMLEITYPMLPPSLNSSYATNFKTGKRFPSKELTFIKKNFVKLAKFEVYGQNTIYPLNEFCKEIEGKKLCLVIILNMRHDQLYTKKGTIKKFDCSNRIKAIEDCICKFLEIDDSVIFRVAVEKRLTTTEINTVCSLMVHR